MSQLDIVYVLPNIPEPRNINIINLVKNEFSTGVVFWKKDPTQKQYSIEGTKIFEIPIKANDHNPLARIIPTIKYYNKAMNVLEQYEPKCIHVSKIDSMFMVWRYWKKKKDKPRIIYDISDLHTLSYNDSKSPLKVAIRWLLWRIEKMVSVCVDYVLVTSPKFVSEYYKDFYKSNQIIFVPNAPDLRCFDGFHRKGGGSFTIGFIGSVRYYNQMTNLIDVAKQLGIKIFIAGSGIDEKRLRDYAQGSSEIEFYGKFDYRSEIKKLYERIDCVYAIYDTSIKNSRVALPNKLYESAYCKLPIIVSKGVYLAEVVENYRIGVSVRDGDKEELKNAIEEIIEKGKDAVNEGCEKFTMNNSFSKRGAELVKIYKLLVTHSSNRSGNKI